MLDDKNKPDVTMQNSKQKSLNIYPTNAIEFKVPQLLNIYLKSEIGQWKITEIYFMKREKK